MFENPNFMSPRTVSCVAIHVCQCDQLPKFIYSSSPFYICRLLPTPLCIWKYLESDDNSKLVMQKPWSNQDRLYAVGVFVFLAFRCLFFSVKDPRNDRISCGSIWIGTFANSGSSQRHSSGSTACGPCKWLRRDDNGKQDKVTVSIRSAFSFPFIWSCKFN